MHVVRRVLLPALGALAIIIGLLGMHVFTDDTRGHGAPVASAHFSADDSGHAAAPSEDCDGSCLSAPAGHDEMAACVLALLVGILLLLLPTAYGRTALVLRAAATLTGGMRRAPARPPSLLFLSISRT